MATITENGESMEESLEPDNGIPKLNGEVNGSYDEPMEVDENSEIPGKINTSDIKSIKENENNSESVLLDVSNSVSDSSSMDMNKTYENEVPVINEDSATSNGYSEEQQEHVTCNTEENSIDVNEENASCNEEENVSADNDNKNGEEDDELMVLGDEDIKDPLSDNPSTDINDPLSENASTDVVDTLSDNPSTQGQSTANDNVDEVVDADNTSDIEEVEENDPLTQESVQNDSNIEDSKELESEAPLDQSLPDDPKLNETNEDEVMETKENSEENCESSHSNNLISESNETEKHDTQPVENNEETLDKSKIDEENDKTPDKGKKKKIQPLPINVTPRRSSRNVNKPKTYIDEPDIKGSPSPTKKSTDDPDIEEIVPQDPLAMDSPISDRKSKKTVVVNDPKRLVEIASGNKQNKPGKKEPTLVIIDTNSILSGRGPVPVSPSSPFGHSNHPSNEAGPSQAFSVLPVALPAQGMYPQAMRQQTKPATSPALKPPVILPSLTDDMYVVEAPSFIVPYVYEKPPIKPLKGFVDQVEEAIKQIKAQLEKEDKLSEDNAKEDNDSDKIEKESQKEEKMDVDSEETKSVVGDEFASASKDKEDTKESEKAKTKEEAEKTDKPSEDEKPEDSEKVKKQSSSYFDNPLGKFFIQIGVNLVQEHVQTDLLRSQKRKKEREGAKCTPEVQQAMNSLIRSLEFSKETNEPFKLELKKCEFCSFKTESALVMAHHLETPHMRNYVYRCNFCTLEVRSPHDILYHMEAEHNVRGRLERAPAFHQCPSCPFEDNQKGKLSRHLLSCAKKYRPERNQEPPLDFEPPAKIPRVSRNRPNSMSPGTAVYQAAMSGLKQSGHPLLPKLIPAPSSPGMVRGRGRPQMMNRYLNDMRSSSLAAQQKAMAAQMRPGMLYRPSGTNAQPQVLLPASYQLPGTQLYQVTNHSRGLASAPIALPTQTPAAPTPPPNKSGMGASTAKLLQQPSISITPLPRQQPPPPAPASAPPAAKPGRPAGNNKATFVICEICDGYIKDLEQLRNHMQWIHKVKIHPKMIYNRPPLNCQKCQFRFFTDQGLERHLLGSHGLVTSSMQEAANKGKDGGRCPVCGRVYQWKLLNHVARDHNMSLKPAHLSYKCTVCTATFGMYKQFENHVYSAHSVVAKRVMDKKPSTSAQPSTSNSQGDMLKPLKINDEITIIPQPARTKTKPTGSTRNPQKKV